MPSLTVQMKKQIKKSGLLILRILLIVTAIIFSILFLFDAFVQFRDSDDTLISFFRKRKIPASIGYYNAEGRTLRHVAVGNPDAPVTLVFLHGAPSSLSYFK